MKIRTGTRGAPCTLLTAALLLATCAAAGAATTRNGPASTAGRLVLAVQSVDTSADGRNCLIAVKVRNDTGAQAVNVQVAWMAETDGFGFISEYQVFGDFAVGESRAARLAVSGAPCKALRAVQITRAVCAVGPVRNPPLSCAERVMLDGGRVLEVRRP